MCLFHVDQNQEAEVAVHGHIRGHVPAQDRVHVHENENENGNENVSVKKNENENVNESGKEIVTEIEHARPHLDQHLGGEIIDDITDNHHQNDLLHCDEAKHLPQALCKLLSFSHIE